MAVSCRMIDACFACRALLSMLFLFFSVFVSISVSISVFLSVPICIAWQGHRATEVQLEALAPAQSVVLSADVLVATSVVVA